jgi:hypothetical protein
MVQEVYIYISIFKNMNIYDLDIYTSELGILSSVCVCIYGVIILSWTLLNMDLSKK